jgi:hypothetical protein
VAKLGYPGVPGAPGQEPAPEPPVQGEVLGSDAVSSLVRQPNGEVVIVDNKTGKRRGS